MDGSPVFKQEEVKTTKKLNKKNGIKELRILVADDKIENLSSIQTKLGQYKKENKDRIERIEVFLAFDGLQAFKERQMKYCNIIFMDDQMPQINGFESLNYIEQFTKTKKNNKQSVDPMLFEPSTIVLMADRGNHADEQVKNKLRSKAKKHGLADLIQPQNYVTKPLSYEDIKSRLDDYLDK